MSGVCVWGGRPAMEGKVKLRVVSVSGVCVCGGGRPAWRGR